MPGYLFRPISDEEAREISGWSYEPPYDFYDWMSDPDDLEESLDLKRRKGASFSIFDDEEALVGFFRTEPWTWGSTTRWRVWSSRGSATPPPASP